MRRCSLIKIGLSGSRRASGAAACFAFKRSNYSGNRLRSNVAAPEDGRAPFVGLIVLLLVSFLTGCTTKAKARQEARAAYIAGREQADRMIQSRNNVTVFGAVRNQLVPWTDDLTLAKALVMAEYTGTGNPQEIILVRNGVAQRIDPNELLAGNDIALLQGDLIQIR